MLAHKCLFLSKKLGFFLENNHILGIGICYHLFTLMSFQTCMIFCFEKDAKGHMRSPYFHVSNSKSSENFVWWASKLNSKSWQSCRPAFTCIEQYNVFKKTKDCRWMSFTLFLWQSYHTTTETLTIVHKSNYILNIAPFFNIFPFCAP